MPSDSTSSDTSSVPVTTLIPAIIIPETVSPATTRSATTRSAIIIPGITIAETTLAETTIAKTTIAESTITQTDYPILTPISLTDGPSALCTSKGTVPGIVIGASIGLALITFFVTFFIMRRKQSLRGKGRLRNSRRSDLLEKGSVQQYGEASKATSALTKSTPGAFDKYLPLPADDKTVQTKAKTLLDQIELFVENFYQDTPRSEGKATISELSTFDSPFLGTRLSTALSQSTSSVPVIKHCLAQFTTSSVSITRGSNCSLLPDEFAALPNALRRSERDDSRKANFDQALSQWRVLTAYLSPDPASDNAYIVQRDKQIHKTCQTFLRVFSPWANPGHSDEERLQSLTAILKDAANLGIFFFSQALGLQFQWPTQKELGTHTMAVAPALIKVTDENAQALSTPQLLVGAGIQKM